MTHPELHCLVFYHAILLPSIIKPHTFPYDTCSALNARLYLKVVLMLSLVTSLLKGEKSLPKIDRGRDVFINNYSRAPGQIILN